MHSRIRRNATAIVTAGLAAALVATLAVPAGARIERGNDKFCEILSSDQGAGINFEGLGPAEAEYAATLIRKLSKTGVPTKLKKDFKKLAKIYDRIADGEPADAVIADRSTFVQSALTRFSKYFQTNCAPSAPST